jgi:hypothetical protein
MPQRIRDFAVAALALAAVFTALALIDERVPAHMRDLVSNAASGRLIEPGSDLGNAVATVAANPALDNVFVVAMVAVGVVLLFLMVRT